jgi:hypothetical protein
MLNKIWGIFLDQLWPLLWPIVRQAMLEMTQDLVGWLRNGLSSKIEKTGTQQQEAAESRARAAEDLAKNASSNDERIKAESEANAWREVAQQLARDNQRLKEELDELLRQSQVYSRKRIDSEAERDKAEERIKGLKPPKDSDKISGGH